MTHNTRTETDSFGPIEVRADRYWGAQAERSLGNFRIGWEKQPLPIVRALGIVKRAAAEVNMDLGRLDFAEPPAPRHAGYGREQDRKQVPKKGCLSFLARKRPNEVVSPAQGSQAHCEVARHFHGRGC